MSTQSENEAVSEDAPPTNGQQQYLGADGMAPASHPHIDDKAESLLLIRKARKNLKDQEDDAVAAMSEEGIRVYRDEQAGLLVIIEDGKQKVTIKKDAGAPE